MKVYKITLYIFVFVSIFYCKTIEYKDIKKLEIENYEKKVRAEDLIKQASFYYQKKDYLKSIEFADQSLKEFILFDGYYIKGMSYYQLGDFPNGLKNLLLAEQIQPNQEQLLLTLGLIYSSQKQYEQAILRFEKLLTLNPNDPYYLYRLGLTYKEIQQYERAIPYLEKADQKEFPYRNNVLLLLGDIYFELKDFQKSEHYYNELEKLNPNSEEVKNSKTQSKVAYFIEEGNKSFKNKKYLEAENYFKQVIQLIPNRSVGYFQLGLVYLETKKYDHAIEQFKKAVNISKDVEPYSFLCRTYLESNRYNEALNCLESATKLYPDNEALLNQLALYYKHTGNLKKSISILTRVLNQKSDSLITHKNLYLIYLEEENIEKAKFHLNKILELEKDDKPLWEKENKKIEAISYLKKGNDFLKKRDFKEAEKSYQTALKIYQHPRIYVAIGDLYNKQNNLLLAEKNYVNAIQISENYHLAYEKLLDLYKKAKNQEKYNRLRNQIIQKSKKDLGFGLLYVNLMIQENNLKEALNFNQTLLKNQPESTLLKKSIAYVYYLLALEENSKKNFPAALNFINNARQYDKENPLYVNSEAIIKENQKYKEYLTLLEKAEELYFKENYQKAKEIYERVYEKWKKPLILVRLAEIEFYSGNDLKGNSLLQNALKEKPKEVPVLEALYTRLIELNRLDEAEKGFLEIISFQKDAYYSYYKLGVIQLLKKKYKESLTYFEDAILYNPKFLPSKIGYGIALYFLKDIKRSEEMFRQITSEEGFGREIAFLNVALIQLNQNNQEKAKKELLQLIKLFPEYSDAYYHLAYIEYENRNFLEAERLLKKAIELQKKDVYYWALIKFYKETGLKKDQLKQNVEHFLKTYPHSPYFGRVKEIYLTLNENQPYFELSYTGNISNYQILSYANRFLFYNKAEILSVESNSSKIHFYLKEDNIQSVILNQFLWVIKEKEIKAIEPYLGIELWNKRFSYKICKVFRVLPEFIGVLSSDCKENLYLYYNDSLYPLNVSLITVWNHNLIYIQNQKIYYTELSNYLRGKFQPKPIISLNQETTQEIQLSENYLLIKTNKNLYIFDINFDLTYKESVDNPFNSYKLNHQYLLKYEISGNMNSLKILDLSKKTNILQKNVNIWNKDLGKVVIYKDDLFYLDSKFSLNLINIKNNQEKKFVDLINYKNGIITLHY